MHLCQRTEVHFSPVILRRPSSESRVSSLYLFYAAYRVNATIDAGNLNWFQRGSNIKKAKQRRPYLKCTNCWSKFYSAPVKRNKDNKRQGYNLLFIVTRMSWECGLEAGLITPQEGAHTHPHLANKLMIDEPSNFTSACCQVLTIVTGQT